VVNYFHFVLLEAGALVGSTTKVTFRLAERHLHIRWFEVLSRLGSFG